MTVTGKVVRGSVIWLNLFPKAGQEQAGYRPALVISDGFIDPLISDLAFIVPITSQVKGYAFEVPVPTGIDIDGSRVSNGYTMLEGVALTDHAKSLDLKARNAIVIGHVDPDSDFFKKVITYVRAILA